MNGGNQVSHGPALLTLNTGDGVFTRPSLGAWTLYGLGSENQDLPGFISLSPSLYHGGAQNYGSAFLPASFQGTRIGDGSTPFKDAALSNLTPGDDPALQRLQLDLLAQQNRDHLARTGADARLEARIEAFELAFRMQMAAPQVFDLAGEAQGDAGPVRHRRRSRPTSSAGSACWPGGWSRPACASCRSTTAYPRNYWDAHGDLKNNHATNAQQGGPADRRPAQGPEGTRPARATRWWSSAPSSAARPPARAATAATITRTPSASGWPAAACSGGMTYGQTDEFGYYVAENKVTIPDFHATILHLLGLDHTRLTYRHAGRDFRLTDVHGEVVPTSWFRWNSPTNPEREPGGDLPLAGLWAGGGECFQ